jgi:hypothetical protein
MSERARAKGVSASAEIVFDHVTKRYPGRPKNTVIDRVLGVRRVPAGDEEPMRPMFPAAAT